MNAVLSVSEASSHGLSHLISTAEAGTPIAISRHGKVVAEVISSEELNRLRYEHEVLNDTVIAALRLATDDGRRMDLDDVIRLFGLDPQELHTEVEEELRE